MKLNALLENEKQDIKRKLLFQIGREFECCSNLKQKEEEGLKIAFAVVEEKINKRVLWIVCFTIC